MNRSERNERNPGQSVPRVGGDEPVTFPFGLATLLVFPAWAGMNRRIRVPKIV